MLQGAASKGEQIKIRKHFASQLIGEAKRVVVKVGSGVLTRQDGLNVRVVAGLARQICWLMDQGRQVILVSSGAVASGMKRIGLTEKPTDIPRKQAVAAVGQARLILEYEKGFDRCGKKVAQILLTRDDLTNRHRYLNARNTMNVLLDWNIVPIINENDTVVVDELKFGDNDNLSGMIAQLMDAQILVCLTDIDGLYDNDPRKHEDASLVPLVPRITRALQEVAGDVAGAFGTGGMSSKVQTAKKVTASGISMVIACGLKPNILKQIFEGKNVGTFFMPHDKKMASWKRWIAFTLTPQGTIRVDAGAANAICRHGKSLLPIGIKDVDGDFGVGAMVDCVDPNGTSFARGLVNYSAPDIVKLKGVKADQIEKHLGYKHYDEVIHRDNLVVMGSPEIENPMDS